VSRLTSTAAAALLAVTFSLPAAAKPPCYTPQEVRAMQFRQLQVELMVAALKCQDPELGFRGKYASYVGKFGPALNRNAKDLRALFSRLGKGTNGMDRYMTELSNEASMRSQHIEDYCGVQSETFDKVLSLKPQELDAWASDKMEKPVPASSCAPPKPAKPIKQAKATADKPAAKPAVKKTESKG
jgi:hypothetical protein